MEDVCFDLYSLPQSQLIDSFCSIPHFLRLSLDLLTPTLSRLSVLQVGKLKSYLAVRYSAASVWLKENFQLYLQVCFGGVSRTFVYFKKLFLDFNRGLDTS